MGRCCSLLISLLITVRLCLFACWNRYLFLWVRFSTWQKCEVVAMGQPIGEVYSENLLSYLSGHIINALVSDW